jgi:hypothetical protein
MRDEENITFRDAELLGGSFKNFEGRETEYNREGDRNFCVIIPDDLAPILTNDGWNIKQLKVREEGDIPRYYMKVSVSFKGRPPLIALITSKGRTNLSITEVDMLGWVDIAKVDMIVRPYHWSRPARGKMPAMAGVSAYLKTMFVTVAEDELMLEYSDVPEIGSGRDYIDAEVVEDRLAIER